MSLVIIILCLLLQQVKALSKWTYQIHWFYRYYQWIFQKVEYVSHDNGFVAMIIFLLPPLIISSLLFSLIYHFGGIFVYALFNFFLVWFCLDTRILFKNALLTSEELLILSYQRIFAVVFWFVIFGPTGLILYTSTAALCSYLKEEQRLVLLGYALKLRAVLDWVPIRLLGLTYALVGHYLSVFKVWRSSLPIWNSDVGLILDYGRAALGIGPGNLQVLSSDEVYRIIVRAFVLWLLVIAVLTIIFWL